MLTGWIRRADLVQKITDILKDWLNALGHGAWAVNGGQEVGDAGHDADSRLLTNLGQGITEDLEVAAGKDLGSLYGRPGTATCLIDIVLDVGVTDQGIDPNQLRHLEAE